MADNVCDGSLMGDGWNTCDQSALDQSMFYPADMSCLPTSTPNAAKLRRKSRRSWFETTPKGYKFDIAIQEPVAKKPRPKSDTVEVLTLTHFSGAPRLGFGTVKLGQENTCTLLLRNPHNYGQSVKVEKVPEKKHFSVSCKEFVVGPEESYPLEITWAPTEAGGCREMVMMLVDGAYRVQAYVFGTALAPPPQKKKGKRVGLLASKAVGPFSVIHTTSLANINHQYSPEKMTAMRTAKPSKAGLTQPKSPTLHTQTRLVNHGKGPTKGRKSNEVSRKSVRLSGKVKPILNGNRGQTAIVSNENLDPAGLTSELVVASHQMQTRKSSERIVVPKRNVEENIPRKKMRRSNTYSNVCGPGLVVPIIHGDIVNGHKDTSLLHIKDCEINFHEVLAKPLGNTSNMNRTRCIPIKTSNLEPSFLEPDERFFVQHTRSAQAQSATLLESWSPENEGHTLLKTKLHFETQEPSFLEPASTHIPKTSVLTAIQNIETYHDSLEGENQSIEAPSFLFSEDEKLSKPRRSHRKRSGINVIESDDKPTSVKLLRTVKKNTSRVVVDPDTFEKDIVQQCDVSHADDHKPLNDSVGQSTLLEQLKSLRSFVHDKSVEIERCEGESFLKEEDDFVKDTCVIRQTSPRFSMPGNDISIRRETFVTEPTKLKLLESQKPSEASPRRTTITVIKGANNKPVTSKLNDEANALYEEDEVEADLESERDDDESVTGLRETQNVHVNDVCEISAAVQKESSRLYSDETFDKQQVPDVVRDKQAPDVTKVKASDPDVTKVKASEPDVTKVKAPESDDVTKVKAPEPDDVMKVKAPEPDVTNVKAPEPEVGKKQERTTLMTQSKALPARVTRQTTRNVVTARAVSLTQGLKRKAGTMKGLAHSKLILSKKSKSAIPKHPLAFAAKNMFYDERWMEKQERGFVNWLNFILTPPEEHQGSDVKVKVDAGKLTIDVEKGRNKLAPTNEILSFRTYSAHRKLNRLRKSSCRLFQSDSMRRVIQKLEAEVESNRLLVRKDKMLHADLGAKQKILDLLLSYNPLWLRIGLETIFGEVVPLQSNTDVYGLSRFLIMRVLVCPDIANEYAHPTVPNLYRGGYAEATAQHTLKKFLMLVYFLDQAKQQRLIDHNPCLFCKNSDIKISKGLLLHFSRDFLSGEGDITRHLGYLGYKVTYAQSALDEFDFAVKTLATDLRDGLRLTRVMEIICSKTDLSKTLRVPAISRLQKVHNMEIVFKTLVQQNIETGTVTTRDIVDGHRERTLSLLWMIILHYQVAMVINIDQIREEVQILERSLRLKKQLHRLVNFKSDAVSRRESEGPDLHTQDERLNLLMKWCRAVCAFYDIKIENFTVSFSDGRALCHILHYYHPGLLPLSQIHNQTTMTHMESMEKNCQQNMNCSLNDSVNSSTIFGDVEDPAVYEQLLANEKENFKRLSGKVKELGGVPLMLRWLDMSNTIPDEKVVVTYLMYLCARLLDIRHESRAARVIQNAWRAHRLRKLQAEYKVKLGAVVVIQRVVQKFLLRRREERHHSAALCIQRVWRGHRARSEARQLRQDQALQRQIHAVILVQCAVKRYIYRRKYLQMKAGITQLQAYCRGYLLRRKRQSAATNIQRVYRGHVVRRQLKHMKNSAIIIQAGVRGFLHRKGSRIWMEAAQKIQRRFRAHLEMKREKCVYQTMRKSCITIQNHWRRHLSLKREKQRLAAIQIQACLKSYLARKRYLKLREKTIYIQASIRGHLQRRKLGKCKNAVLLIQRRFRDYLVAKQQRERFLRMRKAVIVMQSRRRMITQRKQYLLLTESAIRLQASARMFVQRRKFQKMRSSAVIIQKYCRAMLIGRVDRKEFLMSKGAAITIQTAFRGHMVRKEMVKCVSAATVIQSAVKCYFARRRFIALKAATVLCQRKYRAKTLGQKQREHFMKLKSTAIVLQNVFRGQRCRMSFVRDRNNIIKAQSIVRMFLCRRRYRKVRRAVGTVQTRYRAKQLGESCRRQYLITVGATITLQAAARGLVCRRRYRESRERIIHLQAAIKGYLQYTSYQKLKKSTLQIQRRLRETLVARQQRMEFVRMKQAAVVVQSAWRMTQTRKQYSRMLHSAVVIQSVVRQWIHRNRYQKLKSAVLTIEKHYCAKVKGESCRRQFLVSKGAVITLQAAYRAYKVRKTMKDMWLGAVKIQAMYRGFVQRNRYRKLKSAAMAIEKYYSAKVKGESCRRQFLVSKGATITLQSAYRGHKVRKEMEERQQAAVRIQAVYKGFVQRNRYQELKSAAMAIEKYYSAKVKGESCRRQFLVSKGAAICLQSAYRGHKVRKEMEERRQAAVIIQAVYRRFTKQKQFHQLKDAIISCQRKLRANMLTRRLQGHYVHVRHVIIAVQAGFRGYIQRRQYLLMRASAVRIQAVARGYLQRQRYQKTLNSIITIQRRVRETLLSRRLRCDFLKLICAVIVTQSAWRMRCERRRFIVAKAAAVLIQARFRGFVEQKKYQRLKSASQIIQKHFRGKMAGESCRRQFLICKGAVITMQAWYRGHAVRKEMKRLTKSTILVQSVFRGFSQRRMFVQKKSAAVVCQRHYRAKLICRKFKGEFECSKKSVVHLQAAVRGWICRREFLKMKSAVIKIQGVCRMYIARCLFQRQRRAAVAIQQWYRGIILTNAARHRFLVLRGAAITIQANVKMYIIHKLYLQTVASRRYAAAVKIQSMVRTFLERRRFGALRKAAVTCQRKYRAACHGQQERRKYIELKKSAVTIQAHFRRFQCQRSFQKYQLSVVRIQALFRGVQARRVHARWQMAARSLQTRWRAELLCRQHVMQYHQLRDTAIAMQSLYRGKVARDGLRRLRAAIKIQSNCRMMIQRREYCRVRKSAVIIQSGIQVWQARRQLAALRRQHGQQRAAVKIQTAVRSWRARKLLSDLRIQRRELRAAVQIQSAVRMWQAKRRLAVLKEQMVVGRQQCLARFSRVVRVNMAAMTIQRCYRNHRMMLVAKERLQYILVIQRWTRSRLQRMHYLRDRRLVVRLQSHMRMWLARRDRAARVIQRAARHWHGSADVRTQNRATLKIQTLWRGFCVRKNIKSRRMTLVLKRVQLATASATEEKKLCNRTTSALDFLLKYRHLSQVIEALMHLEVASRLSWICCERMVDTNAILVLYRLMRSCNRSLPHMEIIKYTVNILTNLAKYEKTRPAVYEAECGVATLVDIMQIYREKGPIFNKTCTLLGIVALDNPCKLSVVQDKKLVDRLRSIQTLTSRKHKLEETQRVTRARINSSCINATFTVRSPMKKQKIKPDWLLHKDKMNDIVNPLKAINFVLENFGIQTNSK